MHVVTASGSVETGFDAYRAISWSVPLLWPIAPLLYVPGRSNRRAPGLRGGGARTTSRRLSGPDAIRRALRARRLP